MEFLTKPPPNQIRATIPFLRNEREVAPSRRGGNAKRVLGAIKNGGAKKRAVGAFQSENDNRYFEKCIRVGRKSSCDVANTFGRLVESDVFRLRLKCAWNRLRPDSREMRQIHLLSKPPQRSVWW